ncbi:MAG: iron ABC transporter permease, partial [Chloroflexi bacterium]|nr:iron ABC transporter permease [Chloroflexota bacterium]
MKIFALALRAAPLAFLIVFFFYPLAVILRVSFAPDGSLDFFSARDLLSDPYYARVLAFTFFQAALSTLLTLLAAFPAAYIFSHYRLPASNGLRALITIPFLMPTIVIAAAFNALLGPRGGFNELLMRAFQLSEPPIDLLDTIWIIFIAHVFYNFSIAFRIVSQFWSTLSPHYRDAARVLGASRARAFFHVTLPLLMPAIVAAALLIFIFDFTSFGVILLLGGARFATLEVEIYRQTVNLFNLPLAATLSLLQIICTSGLMLLYTRVNARVARPLALRPSNIARRKPQTAREKIFVFLTLALTLIFLSAPLVTLTSESFITRDGLSWQNYAALFENVRGSITFVPPIDAVRNSLAFAAIAVALALILGIGAAYSITERSGNASLRDTFYMLPLGTSAVTLGFGFLIALDRPPLALRATIYLVPIAHALVAFPFVVRALVPILRSIKPQLRDAARVLGASPARMWRAIDLPIIARALIVGGIFAFVISLGEFGATALIALPEFPTMPLAIYRLLGEPGIA